MSDEVLKRVGCLITSTLHARYSPKRAQRFYLAWCWTADFHSRCYCGLGLLENPTAARQKELILRPPQQPRQLGDVGRDAPGFIAREGASSQTHSRSNLRRGPHGASCKRKLSASLRGSNSYGYAHEHWAVSARRCHAWSDKPSPPTAKGPGRRQLTLQSRRFFTSRHGKVGQSFSLGHERV